MAKLLTEGFASPKLAKDERYLTYILYLASAAYDKRLCPSAGDCIKSCLIVKAGRGAIGGPDNMVQRARKRKSDQLFSDRAGFLLQLNSEIVRAKAKASKLGLPLAIRLNGGSDLDWTDVYSMHPDVQFWEYTKRVDLAVKLNGLNNVHVTFSHSEQTTPRIMRTLLEHNINIAMVFETRKGRALPGAVGTVPVVDGDLTDLRFLDPTGVVVGLRLKSLRKPDLTNNEFVQRVA